MGMDGAPCMGEHMKGCRQKTDRLCDWCKKHGFVDPVPCGRIPRHFPDYSPESSSKPHYLEFFATPTSVDGKPRPPDDYQPRANI